MKLSLPALGCVALLWLPLAVLSAPPQADLTALMAEIRRERDQIDPEKLREVAGLRTRAAMEGLIEAYGLMASVYMRLEVVRSLALFDGVADAQQPALQKVADVATSAEEPELRDGALEALGQAQELGKFFLERIVESPADDLVREQAMRLHVARAEERDVDWYNKIYAAAEWQEKKGKKKEGEPEQAYPLPKVRELALRQIAGALEVKALVEAAEEKERDANDLRKDGIRYIALEELFRRKDKAGYKVAADVYKDVVERSTNRILAARILFEEKPARMVEEFLDDGPKIITPLDMAYAMANMIVEHDNDALNKKLVKQVGKGKARDKLFVVRAVRGAQDDKLDKAIAKMLGDEDREVRLEAVRVLGERKAKDALPELEALLEVSSDELLLGQAIDALSAIHGDDPAWVGQLVTFTSGDRAALRNAALAQLGKRGGHTDVLVKALDHADWSTRHAALVGLEADRSRKAAGAVVVRMQQESGRLLHECADVLWRLSGEPYRINKVAWKGWWEKLAADWQPITLEELAKRTQEEEDRRLKQVSRTAARFFGITIESHRVIFVIDVSGSMAWATRSAEPGTDRLVVAKRELKSAIDALEPEALFNVITFSSDVSYWLDGGISDSKTASRDEAKTYIERLGAQGGTNIYGALRAAFDDPDVDTIYFMSDGEPSVGDVIDPGEIRERVREWNEHRGVRIHTVSVGGTFDILDWLAEDSGGASVRFP